MQELFLKRPITDQKKKSRSFGNKELRVAPFHFMSQQLTSVKYKSIRGEA